jgi:hydroxymethylpyrimidine pyrophosphatase-like HAD family hydrolase
MTPKSRTSPDVFLFDVDGVLTDDAAIVDEVVVHQVLMQAAAGSTVALITGRSAQWLDRWIKPAIFDIVRKIGSNWVSNVVWAGEMGSIRRRGLSKWEIAWDFAVPSELRKELENRTQNRRYKPYLQWDKTKQVTATVEAIHSPGDAEHQSRTRSALAEWLAEAKPLATKEGFRVQLSTYAVDVLSASLSKRVGVEYALEPLAVRSGQFAIRVFGDSPGDVAMAEAAASLGYENVTFYWLGSGPQPSLPGKEPVVPPVPHAKGTRLILQTLTQNTST